MKELFENLKAENRAGLVMFVSCGDPSIDFTEKLVRRACAAGADIIELGVPFSDPMADGPTIQASSARAIKGGCTLGKIFDMVARLRAGGVKNKFVLFSYYNPIFKFGLGRAAEMSEKAGIDAWLVVDVPLEESAEVVSAIAPRGIDFIPLAAPTSPIERVGEISRGGGGFLYYVSVAGITGARSALPAHIAERLAQVRKASALPVAVGFGISSPEMAAEAAKNADAVVVGSKFIDKVHSVLEASGGDAALDAAESFVASLARAMKRPQASV